MSLLDRIKEHDQKNPKNSLLSRIKELDASKAESDPDWFRKGWEKATGYAKEPLISTLELGQTLGELVRPPFISKGQPIDWRQEVGGVPKEERNLGHQVAGIVPEIAASILAPEARIPEVGGFLAKSAAPFLKNVATQGGIGAAFNSDTALESGGTAAAVTTPFSIASQMIKSQSAPARLTGRLLQAALGGYGASEIADKLGAGSIGDAAAGSIGALLAAKGRDKGALRDAARTIKEGVKDTEYKTLLDYGRDLGLKYQTPVEASGTQSLGRLQGATARTDEGGKLLYKEGEKRIASEKQAWDNILNTIYNPEYSKTYKTKLYESAHNAKIPSKDIQKFINDPVIAQGIKDIEGNSAFQKQLKDVPADSLKYWDYVKKAISDRERALKLGTEERSILAQSRNELVDSLDKISPQYKQGRAIAELENTKKGLVKALNKADIKGTNIYNLLRKDTKFDELMHSLRNVPEAQEKLKKFREVTKNLVNPITPKTSVGYATTGMYEGRNTAKEIRNEIIEKFASYFKGGSTGEKIAELLTNPEWDKEIDNILKLTKGEKVTAKGVDITGKALGQAFANQGTGD